VSTNGDRQVGLEANAMSDVNTFIETIGKDVNTIIVPHVHTLAQQLNTTVSDFITATIEDVFHRYRPEITGELHARLVSGAIEVTGQNVTLDIKQRTTGQSVSSLDIPVSLRIRVEDLTVRLQNTSLKLNVIR
jgi:hypothetical protein